MYVCCGAMLLCFLCLLFFFFKQKTAYDMRISDWSSDVCSSDLGPHTAAGPACRGPKRPKQWQYDPSRPRRALQGHRRDEPLACQAGRRKNSIEDRKSVV